MATHDYIISNASGAAVRSDLNNALAAIVSNNSAATEPTTTYAYMWWADTTAGQLKIRNAANDGWVVLQELDGTLLMEDGTVGAPGLAFASDLDTGFYRPADNELGIATGGTNAIYIDNAQQVGIGTTSPSQLLHLESAAPRIRLIDTDDSTGGQISSAGGNLSLTYDINGVGSRALTFNDNSGEKARIDSSGRLLVGTSTRRDDFTGTNLEVEGVGSGSGRISATSNNSVTGAGPAMFFGRSRGTADGADTIVQNGDDLGSIFFHGADGTDLVSRAAQIVAEVDGTPGANDMPGRLVFSTTADGDSSPTERMTITAAGFVCPDASSTDNQGNYNSSTVGGFRWVAGSSNTTVRAESYGNSTSGRYHQAFSNPNGVVGSISTNGSATAYNTSSDYRLKENVVSLTGAVDRVKQLKPSQFNFIADPDQTVDGFLAHEAQAVVPECVTGTKDEVDDEGNPVYQGIDQSKLVPLLTAALQEALAKIETLEQRLSDAGIA